MTMDDLIDEVARLRGEGRRPSKILFKPEVFKGLVLNAQGMSPYGTFKRPPPTILGLEYRIDGSQEVDFIVTYESADHMRELLNEMAGKAQNMGWWAALAERASDEELLAFGDMIAERYQ